MTEIGKSLREARIGRGLELAEIEASTKIRAGYLAALEEERFGVFPGRAYGKAFLRTYAQYLGLQWQLLVDELDARLPPDEPPMALRPLRTRRSSRVPSPAVLLPVAAGLTFVALLAAGEFSSDSRSPKLIGLPSGAASRAVTPAQHALPPARPRAAGVTPKVARVMLTASHGDCWLLVRIGSETGRVLYENTLSRGSSISFSRPRLWIRIGAPGSLNATLNGNPIRILPLNNHPTNILLSRGEVHIV